MLDSTKTRYSGSGLQNYCRVSRVLKFVFVLTHRVGDPKLARDILIDIIHNQCRNLARAANDAKKLAGETVPKGRKKKLCNYPVYSLSTHCSIYSKSCIKPERGSCFEG
jgi:hypothetical protein